MLLPSPPPYSYNATYNDVQLCSIAGDLASYKRLLTLTLPPSPTLLGGDVSEVK